jgi:hypothetical protein
VSFPVHFSSEAERRLADIYIGMKDRQRKERATLELESVRLESVGVRREMLARQVHSNA